MSFRLALASKPDVAVNLTEFDKERESALTFALPKPLPLRRVNLLTKRLALRIGFLK